MAHPAWQSLSPTAFKLVAYLLAKYRPNKPNSFEAGGARLGLEIGVGEKAARNAVQELIDNGHLREEHHGRSTGPRATRERVVSLTRWDTEASKGDPELPKKFWRESNPKPA